MNDAEFQNTVETLFEGIRLLMAQLEIATMSYEKWQHQVTFDQVSTAYRTARVQLDRLKLHYRQ